MTINIVYNSLSNEHVKRNIKRCLVEDSPVLNIKHEVGVVVMTGLKIARFRVRCLLDACFIPVPQIRVNLSCNS